MPRARSNKTQLQRRVGDMVDQVGAADVIHPLAEAGVHLPKPKEPEVADAEGIKSVDPT